MKSNEIVEGVWSRVLANRVEARLAALEPLLNLYTDATSPLQVLPDSNGVYFGVDLDTLRQSLSLPTGIVKRIYTVPGTYTWVYPTDPTFTGIDVDVLAGGGAAPAFTWNANTVTIVSGGGGGGRALKRFLTADLMGASQGITVGAGSAGSGGGGASAFGGFSVAVVADGGTDGFANQSLAASAVAGPGGGGVGVIGDVLLQGDDGDTMLMIWGGTVASSMFYGGKGGAGQGYGQRAGNRTEIIGGAVNGYQFIGAGGGGLYRGYGSGASGGARGDGGGGSQGATGGQGGLVTIYEYYGINVNAINTPPTAAQGILEDQFVGANGTNLTAHAISPTNVNGTSWTNTGAASITIQSNNAQTTVTGAHDTVDVGVSDKTMLATLRYGTATTDGVGLSTRVSSGGNYYYGLLSAQNQTLEIWGSTLGLLASVPFASSPGTDYAASLQESGNTLTWTVAGTPVSATMTLFAGVTRCGILVSGNGGSVRTWKDYRITTP